MMYLLIAIDYFTNQLIMFIILYIKAVKLLQWRLMNKATRVK